MTRFLVDVMLKKAGRWLRMLGYYVENPLSEDDDEILKQAQEHELVLLTMDEELYARAQRRGLRTLLITASYNPRQVAQIMEAFNLTLDNFPSRTHCSNCNGKLKEVAKSEVKGKIPERSFKNHERFWLCTSCGQVFWEGSHWNRIEMEVEKIRKELKEE